MLSVQLSKCLYYGTWSCKNINVLQVHYKYIHILDNFSIFKVHDHKPITWMHNGEALNFGETSKKRQVLLLFEKKSFILKHIWGTQTWILLTYFLNKKSGWVTNCLWLTDRTSRFYFPLKVDSSLVYNKINTKWWICSGQITNQLEHLNILTNGNVRIHKELHIRKQAVQEPPEEVKHKAL